MKRHRQNSHKRYQRTSVHDTYGAMVVGTTLLVVTTAGRRGVVPAGGSAVAVAVVLLAPATLTQVYRPRKIGISAFAITGTRSDKQR